ncbi:hypothetical protein PHYBOEH_009190 [Phytophthora boehmeriae]|uniref:RxLR effector protein n=1 Tax=Phytophthora boehmeriae TaxID=109152 RepID=A0A8T1VYM5_9STRA|nr:hypothetical protein PHYBOEH_009190 [Phytophthora boehmeriae]
MRLHKLLLVVSAALFASSHIASAARVADTSPVTDVSAFNAGNRALRARGVARDDEDSTEERTGLSLKFLNEIDARIAQAAKLDDVKGLKAVNSIRADLEPRLRSTLQAIKNDGWTPSTMGKQLNIGEKIKKLTPAQLRNDGDYQFWVRFTAFYKKSRN